MAGARPADDRPERLLAEGLTEEEVSAAEGGAKEEIERACEAALAAPYPDPHERPGAEFAP